MRGGRNVFLVGPMGAGKSTIGRLLAQQLRWPFVDTDREIEQRCGADIPWIFEKEGEPGFREREASVLEDLCQGSGAVIATGGGIVLRPENRQRMAEAGVVVYLDASVAQLVERTARDKRRPLLQVDDPRTVIENLLLARDPLYRSVADVIVHTDQRAPRVVAGEVAEQIQPFLPPLL